MMRSLVLNVAFCSCTCAYRSVTQGEASRRFIPERLRFSMTACITEHTTNAPRTGLRTAVFLRQEQLHHDCWLQLYCHLPLWLLEQQFLSFQHPENPSGQGLHPVARCEHPCASNYISYLLECVCASVKWRADLLALTSLSQPQTEYSQKHKRSTVS